MEKSPTMSDFKYRIWTQSAQFSCLESPEGVPAESGSMYLRCWKELIWGTAETEQEARDLIDKYYSTRIGMGSALGGFQSSLNDDFQISDKPSTSMRRCVHGQVVDVERKLSEAEQ